ncbi:MAG: hypothetical protein ACOYNL_07185 [Rickettsiales bacterium]
MWNPMQKMLNGGEVVMAPPAIPLRKALPALEDIAVGKLLRFSASCPLQPLTASDASVLAIRQYRFGNDVMKSYQLQVGSAKHYYLTIAEDEQGHYLGISRMLNDGEQESWFGRDALGFFTEPSSAKSIRCKVDLMIDGEWAAARYVKTVDWVEGSIAPSETPRLVHSIQYSLLVNESGDKALEIEHENTSGENRFFITVYRPIEDIISVDSPRPAEPTPKPEPTIIKNIAANDDVPLFKEPMLNSPATIIQQQPAPQPQPKQRHDFRRLDEALPQIHIERTPPALNEPDENAMDLPSFLLNRDANYLSLDSVIPPEPERVRVGLNAARGIIEVALRKNVRVRDVLRDMLGLESTMSDEVIFELPLSDADYRTLAMRYKLRPDHRVEIRSRLEEELQQKLTGISKI